MTSHSSEIISPLPASSVRFFRRDINGVRLAEDARSPVLLQTIGVSSQLDILVFVEDQAAKVFAKLWAEHFDPSLAHRMDVIVKGGEGEITKVLRCTERRYKSVTTLGLFDGDARGKIPADLKEGVFFLPGERPVEQMFRSLVDEKTDEFVVRVGGDKARDVLFSLLGTDPHDWFEGLATGLSLEKNQLFYTMFTLWLETKDNALSAAADFAHIKDFVAQ